MARAKKPNTGGTGRTSGASAKSGPDTATKAGKASATETGATPQTPTDATVQTGKPAAGGTTSSTPTQSTPAGAVTSGEDTLAGETQGDVPAPKAARDAVTDTPAGTSGATSSGATPKAGDAGAKGPDAASANSSATDPDAPFAGDTTLSGTASDGETLPGATGGSDTIPASSGSAGAGSASSGTSTKTATGAGSSIPSTKGRADRNADGDPIADRPVPKDEVPGAGGRDTLVPGGGGASAASTGPNGAGTPPGGTPAPAESGRSGGPGFVALLLGGVLAGAIGFAVATYSGIGGTSGTDTALVERLDAQAGEIQSLQGTLSDLSTTVEERSGRIDSVEQQLATLSDEIASAPGGVTEAQLEELRNSAGSGSAETGEQVAALADRIDALEQRIGEIAATRSEGSAETGEALDAYARQLETLQSDLDAQRQEISQAEERATSLQQQSEAQARALTARAALTRIQAAVEGGDGYAGALSSLTENSNVAVPEVLAAQADSGVASIGALQVDFLPAARDSLAASRNAGAGSGSLSQRFGTFLRSQTEARSLGEREGDDPDAVLSRAEARLTEGDLAAALAELDALPEEGRAEMAEWIDTAETRIAVDEALASLTADLSAN
ncbi:hypothetical protein EKE94_10990 [Mesobaculum littorinae]|uniref:Uncharacterized protein n=1 Tax=Mesobaculum littorinae TaxID=2486419 RepID=A0A438AH15_9RHOB|nr:hypothetical protein [Mesobaculum littorinae]RVV97984.1 hypothetical protein EKE94_10990 [Mesobaculum littorinae]